MYTRLSLTKFLIAAIVVTIPAVILQETNPRYTWTYVGLIMLSIGVFYSGQLGRFVNYIGGVK